MNFYKDANLSFRYLLLAFRISVIATFLGRAWQHLYWDGPYRAILWDESWMSGLVTQLGWTWSEWISSPAVSAGMTWMVRCIGVVFLLSALAAFRLGRHSRWERWLIGVGTGLLLLLAFVQTKEKFFHLGQFFEYALQWGSPIVLLILTRQQRLTLSLAWTIRVLISLTFTCHGLYAVGYYPRPGNFVMMTMAGFGVSDLTAVQILYLAGILDFVVAFLLLLPWRQVAVYALGYMVVWGFLTTMARIWSYAFLVSGRSLLLQWVHESVLRWPHFLVPAGLLIYWMIEWKRVPSKLENAMG